MDKIMLNKFNTLFKRTKITLPQLYATFYIQEDFNELIEEITNFISNNVEELALEDGFLDQFHMFLFNLYFEIKNSDNLYALRNLNNQIKKSAKQAIKPYNKKELKKDHKYHVLYKFIRELEINDQYLDSYMLEISENMEFKIVWFIINSLSNPDYFFRYIELKPEIVNTKSSDGKSLFYKLVEYYLAYIDDIDTKYYKRIIVMLLESDKLLISNDELFALLGMLEKNVAHSSIENKQHINFVIQEINRHYTILNQDARCNAIDYAKKTPNISIITPSIDGRIDLTNLFTVSIDSINSNVVNNVLIDDALSIDEKENGEFDLYIHIPDVDEYIKRDTPEDDFMRNIGESIYAKDYKTPLINFDAAKKISLTHGLVKPAITFRFSLDEKCNLTNIEVMESIINVNYNLSKRKADMFMSDSKDKKLTDSLRLLHKVAKSIRKIRKARIGKNKKASLIMEETNIILDIFMAEYFNKNRIIFPYKNYFGLRSEKNKQHVELCNQFVVENELTDEDRDWIYSVFNINNRVFYDTVAHPNHSFNGRFAGNVGNPLREYISLETLRLIKDILIKQKTNFDYWEDRVEKDVIEYTETSAKIRELYKRI